MAKEKDEKPSLLDRIKSASTIKETDVLSHSKFFDKRDMITTDIPILNVVFSGELDGGFTPGLTMWAGPSKNFKTLFSLYMAKLYMEKYPESILLLYDSEFGAPLSYFDTLKIDKNRVVHCPIVDIEQLRSDLMNQIENFARGDKVIVVIDSVGNLASRKETADALKEHDAADFTRAKVLKSLFRLVTPRLTLKDIPLIVVNHTYKEIGIFPKDIVGGGTGSYYSSQNIYILGRQQEKEEKELVGYNYVINVEKSRYVKEKSKFIMEVSFEKGINKWSGLLDLAVESKHVIKQKAGQSYVYAKKDDIVSYTEKETNIESFWSPILKDPTFSDFIRNKYQLAETDLIGDGT